jgi:WW domain-containing oxidoreductase
MTLNLGFLSTAEDALGAARLNGKVAIVTGANSGIGTETARVLALGGAHVVMACRSVSAGQDVAETLRKSLPSDAGSFEVMALDLADLASVRAFAEAFSKSGRSLDLLVNNAGVMATPLGRTAQGCEMQVGTNHVGHFVLTKLLRPRIDASSFARIVNVSSALYMQGKPARLFETLEEDPTYAHRKYAPFPAYGDSKLANVLFTRHLATLLPKNVETFCLHPGVIPTNLTRSMGVMGSLFRSVGKVFTKSIAQGAATSVYAAVSKDLVGQSGAYLTNCHVKKLSATGRDEALAARLWSVTERVAGAFGAPLA